jgi:hypothetical protein
MDQPLGINDGILLASLVYSLFDLQSVWVDFESCSRPVHHWLVISYASVVIFRLTHLVGMQSGMVPSVDFLLDLRQKGTVPKGAAVFTWLFLVPFFVVWTGLGTLWLFSVVHKTRHCMPTQMHLWFSVLWLVLSYFCIAVYASLAWAALVLERRRQNAEVELQQIVSPDLISRWGQVSELTNFTSFHGAAIAGLSASALEAMPSKVAAAPHHEGNGSNDVEVGSCTLECSICLCDVHPGEGIRELPACGHTFHKSCVDLWLLRCPCCPLCKDDVRTSQSQRHESLYPVLRAS